MPPRLRPAPTVVATQASIAAAHQDVIKRRAEVLANLQRIYALSQEAERLRSQLAKLSEAQYASSAGRQLMHRLEQIAPRIQDLRAKNLDHAEKLSILSTSLTNIESDLKTAINSGTVDSEALATLRLAQATCTNAVQFKQATGTPLTQLISARRDSSDWDAYVDDNADELLRVTKLTDQELRDEGMQEHPLIPALHAQLALDPELDAAKLKAYLKDKKNHVSILASAGAVTLERFNCRIDELLTMPGSSVVAQLDAHDAALRGPLEASAIAHANRLNAISVSPTATATELNAAATQLGQTLRSDDAKQFSIHNDLTSAVSDTKTAYTKAEKALADTLRAHETFDHYVSTVTALREKETALQAARQGLEATTAALRVNHEAQEQLTKMLEERRAALTAELDQATTTEAESQQRVNQLTTERSAADDALREAEAAHQAYLEQAPVDYQHRLLIELDEEEQAVHDGIESRARDYLIAEQTAQRAELVSAIQAFTNTTLPERRRTELEDAETQRDLATTAVAEAEATAQQALEAQREAIQASLDTAKRSLSPMLAGILAIRTEAKAAHDDALASARAAADNAAACVHTLTPLDQNTSAARNHRRANAEWETFQAADPLPALRTTAEEAEATAHQTSAQALAAIHLQQARLAHFESSYRGTLVQAAIAMLQDYRGSTEAQRSTEFSDGFSTFNLDTDFTAQVLDQSDALLRTLVDEQVALNEAKLDEWLMPASRARFTQRQTRYAEAHLSVAELDAQRDREFAGQGQPAAIAEAEAAGLLPGLAEDLHHLEIPTPFEALSNTAAGTVDDAVRAAITSGDSFAAITAICASLPTTAHQQALAHYRDTSTVASPAIPLADAAEQTATAAQEALAERATARARQAEKIEQRLISAAETLRTELAAEQQSAEAELARLETISEPPLNPEQAARIAELEADIAGTQTRIEELTAALAAEHIAENPEVQSANRELASRQGMLAHATAEVEHRRTILSSAAAQRPANPAEQTELDELEARLAQFDSDLAEVALPQQLIEASRTRTDTETLQRISERREAIQALLDEAKNPDGSYDPSKLPELNLAANRDELRQAEELARTTERKLELFETAEAALRSATQRHQLLLEEKEGLEEALADPDSLLSLDERTEKQRLEAEVATLERTLTEAETAICELSEEIPTLTTAVDTTGEAVAQHCGHRHVPPAILTAIDGPDAASNEHLSTANTALTTLVTTDTTARDEALETYRTALTDQLSQAQNAARANLSELHTTGRVSRRQATDALNREPLIPEADPYVAAAQEAATRAAHEAHTQRTAMGDAVDAAAFQARADELRLTRELHKLTDPYADLVSFPDWAELSDEELSIALELVKADGVCQVIAPREIKLVEPEGTEWTEDQIAVAAKLDALSFGQITVHYSKERITAADTARTLDEEAEDDEDTSVGASVTVSSAHSTAPQIDPSKIGQLRTPARFLDYERTRVANRIHAKADWFKAPANTSNNPTTALQNLLKTAGLGETEVDSDLFTQLCQRQRLNADLVTHLLSTATADAATKTVTFVLPPQVDVEDSEARTRSAQNQMAKLAGILATMKIKSVIPALPAADPVPTSTEADPTPADTDNNLRLAALKHLERRSQAASLHILRGRQLYAPHIEKEYGITFPGARLQLLDSLLVADGCSTPVTQRVIDANMRKNGSELPDSLIGVARSEATLSFAPGFSTRHGMSVQYVDGNWCLQDKEYDQQLKDLLTETHKHSGQEAMQREYSLKTTSTAAHATLALVVAAVDAWRNNPDKTPTAGQKCELPVAGTMPSLLAAALLASVSPLKDTVTLKLCDSLRDPDAPAQSSSKINALVAAAKMTDSSTLEECMANLAKVQGVSQQELQQLQPAIVEAFRMRNELQRMHHDAQGQPCAATAEGATSIWSTLGQQATTPTTTTDANGSGAGSGSSAGADLPDRPDWTTKADKAKRHAGGRRKQSQDQQSKLARQATKTWSKLTGCEKTQTDPNGPGAEGPRLRSR